jgi:hypothetical protein
VHLAHLPGRFHPRGDARAVKLPRVVLYLYEGQPHPRAVVEVVGRRGVDIAVHDIEQDAAVAPPRAEHPTGGRREPVAGPGGGVNIGLVSIAPPLKHLPERHPGIKERLVGDREGARQPHPRQVERGARERWGVAHVRAYARYMVLEGGRAPRVYGGRGRLHQLVQQLVVVHAPDRVRHQMRAVRYLLALLRDLLDEPPEQRAVRPADVHIALHVMGGQDRQPPALLDKRELACPAGRGRRAPGTSSVGWRPRWGPARFH